ncbi:MAG: hypothetical protein HKO95_00170 [Rhodobacteraceae bacterium]|nr:hypothetical protein [Alphaproteobacteria bacterium]MBT8474730.1 hypothetical protein [Alphaproteobacteria bacterium]NNF71170.1 hypothetical protein [Paracoccaceae bacterium]NNK65129.1 hypothetical protein [Paracoccaceae bacterium]
MGFLLRWLIAFVLLSVTFNPTQWNFVRWARDSFDGQMPLVVLAGLILLTGYVIYLRATLRSIGAFGMLLVAAIFGALIWVLIDFGIMRLDNPNVTVWLGLLALSLVLGIGLSWSIVRRKLTGQTDVDDVDE